MSVFLPHYLFESPGLSHHQATKAFWIVMSELRELKHKKALNTIERMYGSSCATLKEKHGHSTERALSITQKECNKRIRAINKKNAKKMRHARKRWAIVAQQIKERSDAE